MPTDRCLPNAHAQEGGCFHCCEKCDYDRHICHFCGENLTHDSFSHENGERVRHWLSDCRPDLVEHEIGPDCTWSFLLDPDWIPNLRRDGKDKLADADEGRPSCYAYEFMGDGSNGHKRAWTDEHIHFNTDGPMA